MVQCKIINEKAIARAEYVIEGELLPDVRVREDQNSNTGKAMPEFPGYTGAMKPAIPLIKVKAVTHRRDPIMQSCIGPSEEHVNMAGIPTEASILGMTEKALPGNVKNVYAHCSGGGKYMAVIQFVKKAPPDEGRQRRSRCELCQALDAAFDTRDDGCSGAATASACRPHPSETALCASGRDEPARDCHSRQQSRRSKRQL